MKPSPDSFTLSRIRFAVAVLVAHLFALSDERDIPLTLSSSEKDIAGRAAALKDEDAAALIDAATHTGLSSAAGTYLEVRFAGTTLAEKSAWLSCGLSPEELERLARILTLREAMTAALAPLMHTESLRSATLPVMLRPAPELVFAFPKLDGKRFASKFVETFTEKGETLPLAHADTPSFEHMLASWLSSYALLADQQGGNSLRACAALLRHLGSELARGASSEALIPALHAALALAREDVPTGTQAYDARTDAIVAVALREGDESGARRARAVAVGSEEELKGVVKSLIIPEEAKSALLALFR